MHPQRRHVDDGRLRAVDVEVDDLVGQHLAQRDARLPADDDETLDLAQVVMLTARLARPRVRHERLAAAAVSAHRLDQLPALVGVDHERERVLVRERRSPVCVEQVRVETRRQLRNLAAAVDVVELLEQ